MSARPVVAKDQATKHGEVRAVRETRAGVQAEVCVGFGPAGDAWLKVTLSDDRIRAAVAELHASLKAGADKVLKASQDAQEKRGRDVIGR